MVYSLLLVILYSLLAVAEDVSDRKQVKTDKRIENLRDRSGVEMTGVEWK